MTDARNEPRPPRLVWAKDDEQADNYVDSDGLIYSRNEVRRCIDGLRPAVIETPDYDAITRKITDALYRLGLPVGAEGEKIIAAILKEEDATEERVNDFARMSHGEVPI